MTATALQAALISRTLTAGGAWLGSSRLRMLHTQDTSFFTTADGAVETTVSPSTDYQRHTYATASLVCLSMPKYYASTEDCATSSCRLECLTVIAREEEGYGLRMQLLMKSPTMYRRQGPVSMLYSLHRTYAPVTSVLQDSSSWVCGETTRASAMVLTMCIQCMFQSTTHTRDEKSTLSAASSISKALQNI